MRLASLLILVLTLSALLTSASQAAQRLKFRIEFVPVQFPAPRETKAVELAMLRSSSDAALKARFDHGRAEFEQGILELNMAKEPTPQVAESFTRQAAAWTALGEESTLPPQIRGAALHNVANCYTVIRDYAKALESSIAATVADPKQRRYAVERDAIRNGFYAKRTGYQPVEIQAPQLEPIEIPVGMEGVASGLELSPPLVTITPYRTLQQPMSLIWVNGRKKYRVAYQEKAELSGSSLTGRLTLHNQTERVVDCRNLVVQVFVNGNAIGGPAELQWQTDPSRVVPNGKAVASFGVIRPHHLPAEGTLNVSLFDVPSVVSATGAIEAKRNDSFAWSIRRVTYSLEVVNRVIEESVTEQDGASEGRAVPGKARLEPLVQVAD